MPRKNSLPMMTRSGSFQPETVNEKDRTVEIVWSTGARVLRQRFFDDPFYEELEVSEEAVDLSRVERGMPFLVSHQNHPDAVVAVFERAWIEDGVGKGIVRFDDDEDSERYFRKVKSGILRNVSAGYRVETFQDVTTDEDRFQVLRAVSWELMEASLVAVGADAGAGTRSSSDQTFPCTIEERRMAKKGAKAAASVASRAAEERESLEATEATQESSESTEESSEAAPEQEQEAQDPASETPAESEASQRAAEQRGVVAERTRVMEISHAVRAAQLPEEMAQRLIEGGVGVDHARSEIIKELEKRNMPIAPKGSVIQAGGQDETETKRMAASEAILHRVNPGKNKITELGKRFYGMSLLRICEEFVGRGTGIDIAQRAMSNPDMPFIFADVANKTLLREYQTAQRLFLPLVSEGDLPDFKEATLANLTDISDLEPVGDGGEIKAGVVGDRGEKTKLGYYAKILPFTYHSIVNDDLRALTRLPSLASRAAVRLENRLFFDLLTGSHLMADTKELFHSDHGNLSDGDEFISEATLDELTQMISEQKTSSGGDFLALTPEFIIVGPKSQLAARKLTATGIVPNSAENVNAFAGLTPIVTPWISDYAHILAVGPNQADGIEVSYLSGQREPRLTWSPDFDTSGMKLKVEHHFGVKALDWRPFAKNDGAAPESEE